MEELNNIIIVFVITVHRSYLISAKDRLLDSWNDNDENVGDMIYMSGCRQEEEEEGDGEHDEKKSLLKNAKLLLGNNTGCDQLSWTHNHITATISLLNAAQCSAVCQQCTMQYASAQCTVSHCASHCVALVTEHWRMWGSVSQTSVAEPCASND